MMEREDIERMLGEILVPVSPSDTFLKRLRARLVIYQGGNPFNPWTLVVLIATMTSDPFIPSVCSGAPLIPAAR